MPDSTLSTTYRPQVYGADATAEQRQMYDDVCSDLDFPMCLEVDQSVDDMAILSCRGVRSDRRECAELARRLGLTANAAMLTAYRMGLSAMMDALIALEGKLDGN